MNTDETHPSHIGCVFALKLNPMKHSGNDFVISTGWRRTEQSFVSTFTSKPFFQNGNIYLVLATLLEGVGSGCQIPQLFLNFWTCTFLWHGGKDNTGRERLIRTRLI